MPDSTPLSAQSVADVVERLATREPIPGGGSAAALAGTLAAALVGMVVELSRGRPELAEHETALTEVGLAAHAARSELLNLVDLDANAYAAVVAARRLPRGDDRERDARRVQVDAATREATRVPLRIAEVSATVLELAERLAPIGHRHAVSDVGVAALLAVAALDGAALNVAINLPSLPEDDPLRDEAATAVAALTDRLDERRASIARAVAERIG